MTSIRRQIEINDALLGEKFDVFPSGELYVKHVAPADAFARFRCKVRHKLTNATWTSGAEAAVAISEPAGSVPPRITDSQPLLEVLRGTPLVVLRCAAEAWPVPSYK